MMIKMIIAFRFGTMGFVTIVVVLGVPRSGNGEG